MSNSRAALRRFKGELAGARALWVAALALLVPAAPAGATARFSTPVSFEAGSNPFSLAIADLDRDGRLDLAVANFGSNTVSVLRGMGAGAFAPRADFGTGGAPASVAIADVDGDGRPDLVTANAASSTVSVLLGNGDGTFRTRTDFATGLSPLSVAVADLNADRKPDIAVANVGSSTVSVLLGYGDGTFGAKADYRAGVSSRSVSIADLNADGRPDLAVVNQFGIPASLLFGRGDGTFAPRKDFAFFTRNPSSMAIADLDADGRLDVAVASGGLDAITVMRGYGDGSFGPRTDFGVGLSPVAVAVADFDADGRPDIVAVNALSNSVTVLSQTATGGFVDQPEITTGEFPHEVAVGDLNGDGRADIATANGWSNSVTVILSPTVPMALSLTPRTLNPASRGRWVTGCLEPPAPYAAGDIDISSIRLNGTVPVFAAVPVPIADHDRNGTSDLMVMIDRAALEATLSDGADVVVTIVGDMAGERFLGAAHIRVQHAVAWTPGGVGRTAGPGTQPRWGSPLDETSRESDPALAPDAGAVPASPAMRLASPNPVASGRLRVECALPEDRAARLELLDAAGRVLITSEVGSRGRGVHAIDAGDVGGLRPGMYFLRLTQGGRVARARVAVIR